MSLSQFVIDRDTPVVALDVREAFGCLTDKEKLYVHYLSRASLYGGLIVLLQTSKESPQIYRLLQRINSADSPDSLKIACLAAGVSEEEYDQFQAYAAGFYSFMGNYKGFGDTKIIPELPADKFYALVKASNAYQKDPTEIDEIWNLIKEPMYLLCEKSKQLGFCDKGINKYLSKNVSQKDSDLVNKFLKEYKLEGYINRLIKNEQNGQTVYEIRNAAIDESILKEVEFEKATFRVTTGDYSNLLQLVNDNLMEAQKYCANDNEKNMIVKYIESFKSGSLDAHKDGSRFWIKNKSPVIETYIGFIETYRDPVGIRGEFEGFVSMVNKEQSAKFQELVNQAEKLLARLPWPKGFEKDTFLRPDFTSLDVLTFAGSGIPIGINIPNYDEIRQSEGFKNVNLGNVIVSSFKVKKPVSFVSTEDDKAMKAYAIKALEIQVGLHELLGHGSGKLLMRNSDGTFNFPNDLVNPETGDKIAKWYEPGETFDSTFTSLGSSLEECRAEAVGLFLSCDRDVLGIFGTDSDKVIYVNWLSLCVSALKGLEMYSPASKEWKQSHSQARFVLLQVLLEADNFISVEQIVGQDGQPDLLMTMDESKLETVGRKAIGDFLLKLQVLKSTGDYAQAKVMYDRYSAVNNSGSLQWAKWRDIVVARRRPRQITVQANTAVKENGGVELLEYESNKSGMIKSWADRFNQTEHKMIDFALAELYEKDSSNF